MKEILTDKNFVTVQGWMVTELGLKGNELMAYAVIYGYSQDGNSEMRGGRSFIARWCSIGLDTAGDILKNLCKKGLIQRRDEKGSGAVTHTFYRATREEKSHSERVEKSHSERVEKSHSHESENPTRTSGEIPLPRVGKPHTIYKYIYNNINNNNINTPLQYISFMECSSQLKDAYRAFIEMRKTIKKPLTIKALEMKIDKLLKFSGGDEQYMTDCLLQSVEHSWEDVYELKNRNQEVKSSSINYDELESIGVHPSML